MIPTIKLVMLVWTFVMPDGSSSSVHLEAEFHGNSRNAVQVRGALEECEHLKAYLEKETKGLGPTYACVVTK